jgi:hypothetical protein
LCALAVTLARVQRHGRQVRITGVRAWLKAHLERLDILRNSFQRIDSEPSMDASQGTLHAHRIANVREGNRAGNALAQTVASLIPPAYDDVISLSRRRAHPVELPLAYIFTELIDNSFGHGRARGYSHASVWIAAQYHPQGGLVRIAVADDGCGFLATLKDRKDLSVGSHAVDPRGFPSFRILQARRRTIRRCSSPRFGPDNLQGHCTADAGKRNRNLGQRVAREPRVPRRSRARLSLLAGIGLRCGSPVGSTERVQLP